MPSNEPYQLDPAPPTPRLPGAVIVRATADALYDAAAAEMMLHAQNCVRQFGAFHLALSGGSTPLPLYERLMIDPALRSFPWESTHLWIVDERRVPFDDPRSNFRAINEILGDHSGVPASHVHPMLAMSDNADTAYELELRTHLGRREPGHERLDYILLGLGADGHTASLFPHSPALAIGADEAPAGADPSAVRMPRLVRINSGPTVTPPDRVTMTFDLINTARFIAVLATGAGKRAIVERIAAVGAGPPRRSDVHALPIVGIRPLAGVLRWYLDHDACPTDQSAVAERESPDAVG